MNTDPLFSVIVPTYHRNDLLANCLDCLKPDVQTIPPANQYEVIVTDDGSQTTAEEMIQKQYPWVKWVAGPRKGPAANRNNGAKFAQGKWLVFTDDDCLPDCQWLEAYADAIAYNPDCSVFEGRVYADRTRRTLAEKAPLNEFGGYLWSCNFAIRKPLFDQLQGFDARFPYAAMEDVDFRLRLQRSQSPFLFVKTASLCHPWRLSRGWKEFQQHQQSTLIYLALHPDESTTINALYYLNLVARGCIKQIIPGLFKFRGQGFSIAVQEYLSYLQMGLILAFKQYSIHSDSAPMP